MRRISVPLKNPTDLLSGDQNGNGSETSSVPANGREVLDFRSGNHNRCFPSKAATKTNFWPSGEIAIESTSIVGRTATSKRFSDLSVCCANDVSAIDKIRRNTFMDRSLLFSNFGRRRLKSEDHNDLRRRWATQFQRSLRQVRRARSYRFVIVAVRN